MKAKHLLSSAVFLFILTLSLFSQANAQGIYTARGYWEESNKETYRIIKQKSNTGIVLSADESSYLNDYETYLSNYFSRLTDDEKSVYEKMKPQWDREIFGPQQTAIVEEEFEWRGRDYATNILYGAYYGASLVAVTEISSAAAVGIPLLTGGLWALGPVIVPKKYENINRSVIRASNTGKFLGLVYGGSLALLVAGESDNIGQTALILSSLGSIALGEVGFKLQKKRNFSEGHIELVSHYGTIGPWIAGATLGAAGSENPNLYGAAFLAGGVGGILIANKVSSKYDYTKGDVNNISALSLATTGVGFAIFAETLQNDVSSAVLLIPAAGTVIGTMLGQKAVKGVYLNKKQGSTIGLSTGGAALVGLGLAAIFETDSPTLWVGIPSVLALATQQILFNKYKKDNLAGNLLGKINKDKPYRFSMKVTPENYFVNQQMVVPAGILNPNGNISNPLVNLKLAF
ncbi:hypothetical protein [Aquiflexum gelatinilyticum]|uniref:hypothetical protein n=1 Tax=Aquiflexum gelatinilyticum TaxID=2961943 RepID=UPI002168558C|nr:hypothetical protein [Aquiflexum gelatinilyticum]MCS4433423.1 hypothetical protein [Aquiflexum gelatinilyticum]